VLYETLRYHTDTLAEEVLRRAHVSARYVC